ncbi:MAG: hypothetical protein E7402_04025 [Ruminococcaceae bacterium]|nr:hypothetical protein [Oscillospiraceae bacterium]
MKRLFALLVAFVMLASCGTIAFGADLETPGYAAGIAGVYSSGNEAGNVVENIFDGSLGTKWAHDARPSVVWFKTDPAVTYDHINIALTNGHLRHYEFELAVMAEDGKSWDIVWDHTQKKSSGTTDQLERFDFTKPVNSEWLRFTGYGSDVNLWNNLSEITGVPLQEGPSGLVIVGTEWKQELAVKDVDGQSYLPFIQTAESCGYVASWDQATGVVTAVNEGSGWNLKAVVDSISYTTQEGSFDIEKPLTVIDGELMCPIDSLDELISYNCSLTESSHTYGINYQRATKEILAALDEMSSMISVQGQMELYASLFDPDTCAMYFGQGAVGRAGFGPGIEPTAQSGIAGVLKKYAPDKLQRLGEWVQGLQDPVTGWFMEPEYTIDTQGDGKKQRNLQMGISILNACGMKPLYLTPTERVMQNQTQTEATGGATTEKEEETVLEADAKYQSLEAYMNYVKTNFDWDGDGVGASVWSAGNDIGDIAGTLKELGYLDAVSEFIRSQQRPDNGLFTDEINITGISAVTKLSGMYTLTGTPMPYMDKIIESAAWLAENTDFAGISEPYNISLAIRFMVNSAGSAGLDEATQQQLNEAAPRFVRGLSAGLKKFLKDDGGFGYSPSGPCTHSQGASVLPVGYDCADVNGNQLALGVINDLYWMMGMTTPVYKDEALWWELIKDKAPITEPLIEMPGKAGYFFEDGEIGTVSKGVSKVNPIIEDPVNWHNQCIKVDLKKGGNLCGTGEFCEEKQAINFSIMLGKVRSHGSGLFYGGLGQAVQISSSASSGNLMLYLRRHGSDGIGVAMSTPLEPFMWYDIRIEYEPKGHDDTEFRMYVNGKLTGTTNIFMNSQSPAAVPNKDATGLSFTPYMNTDADIYLDNVWFEADWDKPKAEETEE